MAIADCVFVLLFIWLSHQTQASLAVTGGFLPEPLFLQQQIPEAPGHRRRKKKKRENRKKKVEEWKGGKWGGTQTGRGCNFLRKLSEAFLVWPIRWKKGGEREQKEQRYKENVGKKSASKKSHVPLEFKFTWEPEKEVQNMNDMRWWKNEEQSGAKDLEQEKASDINRGHVQSLVRFLWHFW